MAGKAWLLVPFSIWMAISLSHCSLMSKWVTMERLSSGHEAGSGSLDRIKMYSNMRLLSHSRHSPQL
jgi:hypothetical protein